jgi:NifU-like protein involved in Fe-S cluster formation
MLLDDVYNKRILELAGSIPRLGSLAYAQGHAEKHAKLCGSTVAIDVTVKDGKIEDFAQDVKACVLGQASASVLGHNIIGASFEELTATRDALRAMLKEGGAVPQGRFADLCYLEPVKEYKARHASIMLAFDAVVDATEKALKKAA